MSICVLVIYALLNVEDWERTGREKHIAIANSCFRAKCVLKFVQCNSKIILKKCCNEYLQMHFVITFFKITKVWFYDRENNDERGFRWLHNCHYCNSYFNNNTSNLPQFNKRIKEETKIKSKIIIKLCIQNAF